MGERIQWGNVTVPYTVIWSDEIENRKPAVVIERIEGQRLPMLSEGIHQPTGKPIFKMLHADRCREVVNHNLCQMCLDHLPVRVVTVTQGQQDRYRPLVSDGLPMCPACALEALASCPGMQRQQASGTLRLWLSRRGAWLLAPVILAIASESHGGHESINRLLRSYGRPVFTGPKLVLTQWRLVSPVEIAEEVRATTPPPTPQHPTYEPNSSDAAERTQPHPDTPPTP